MAILIEVLTMMKYLTAPKSGTIRPVFFTAGAVCLAVVSGSAGEPPESVYLTGVVRDFRTSHPDFNPATGQGHYAGNLTFFLPMDRKPVFSGEGFRVEAQWRDVESRPIAPHLFGGWGAGAVLVAGTPTVSKGVTVDTWDSSVGPYGGMNVGPPPNIVAGATMPTIAPPGGMGPSVGNLVYADAGVSALNTDRHCDSLVIRDDHRIRVDGDVTVLCDGDFLMRDGASIELLAGSSLTLYVLGDVEIVDSTINDGFHDPSRFVIYHLGGGQMRFGDGADLYGTLVSPNGRVIIDDDANVYGVLTAADLLLEDVSGLHIDARMPFDQCGNRFADSAGTAGPESTGGITSAASFDQWFRDLPGTNLSTRYGITLVRGGDGVYEFATADFFPVDGNLFGNEGDPHNYHFTYVLDAQFNYDACADQFLGFEGNDDVWVFVDGKLAMDLGGIAPGTEQFIDFDRLGLVEGEATSLVLFYAHRQGPFSSFRIRTNVVLQTDHDFAVSSGFD